MKRYYTLTVAIVAGLSLSASGTIIHVPGDYPTIQQGIDATDMGDTVLVDPGTYYENIVSNGSNAVIGSQYILTGDTSYISSTIIDGGGAGTVFYSYYDFQGPPVFAGFTVQNGSAYSGGGIYLDNTVIEIHSNIIKNNSCEYNGGGIYCDNYYLAAIHDNAIFENEAGYRGGGVYFIDSEPLLSNNRITGNTSQGDGGGVYFWDCFWPGLTGEFISGNQAQGDGGGIFAQSTSHLFMTKCVVADNLCLGNGGGIALWNSESGQSSLTVSRNRAATGGGIFCDQTSILNVVNSIFWGDSASVNGHEIVLAGSIFSVTYTDVMGGFSGNGNINADPMFVDPENGDFHLQEGSPCIDAGDPDFPRDPDGSYVEMGAYFFGNEIPEIMDQSQTVADAGFWFDVGMVRWQQFYPSLNNITAVELFLLQAGFPGDVVLMIATDAGDSLITSRLDEDNVVDGDWNRINLPRTVELTPGEPYRIYVASSQPSPGPDERYTWNGNHDSDYPGITDVYDEEPLYDYAFITYGFDRQTGIEDMDIAVLPDEFRLLQNYPNPFNSSTTIEYDLPSASSVFIEIYDLLGRRVETLVQGEQPAGYHQVVWDAGDHSSSLYFYRLRAADYVDSKKMVLLK
jgi:hypothetical protein